MKINTKNIGENNLRQAAHASKSNETNYQRHRIKDNREKETTMINGQMQLMKNSGGIIQQVAQLATKITNKAQTLQYDDYLGNGVKKVNVGHHMKATLDPSDQRVGSSPGAASGTLYNSLRHYWGDGIKGHLLNDHLGGLGVEENLFPISSSANHQHLEWETTVKGMLLGQVGAVERNKKRPLTAPKEPVSNVYYEVVTTPKNSKPNFDDDPKALIECRAKLTNTTVPSARVKVFGPVTIKSNIASGAAKKGTGMNSLLDHYGWGASGSGVRSGTKKITITPKVKPSHHKPGSPKRYTDGSGKEYMEVL
ncbi:MAG: hypothetical protein NXI10_08015 [bacterium]|nr:hypothetical protein [bacterium]